MTVAELIEKLKTLPQDLPVHINDEAGGVYHDEIDAVFDIEHDPEYDEEAAVVISVNPL
jgi:hypothetical protein